MTILNGVGEGALAQHYSPQWFKDRVPLDNANVSRGEDFSLNIESVELSDSGGYVSSVTLKNEEGMNEYIIPEHDRPIQLTVYSELLDVFLQAA